MPVNRPTTTRKKHPPKRSASIGSPRVRSADVVSSAQLQEIAREARLHGPLRLRLADGQIVTVTAEKPRRQSGRASTSSTSLRQIMLASPLADIDLERPKEYSSVRDVDL